MRRSGMGKGQADYQYHAGGYGGYGGYGKQNNGKNGNFMKGGQGQDSDRFPSVAEKLRVLRDGLPVEAAQAYHALQLSLQPHSRPQGSRPTFDEEFHNNLSFLFPDALDIKVRQIGSWNQWEVKIDDGPSIYCSVRLEVLSDEPAFLKELKNKARVVKDTLLENEGAWKKDLLPGLGNHFEKVSQFEQECRERAYTGQRGDGYSYSDGPRGRSAWVGERQICPICHKPKDEDQLAGEHMCVVFAFFQCEDCQTQRDTNSSWTSYRARLHPDGNVMGQNCQACGSKGLAKDWRVLPPETLGDNESTMSRRSGRGMHQTELCDACREFGNCMGVFYDPFVLTTALSMVSGQYVQWESFSEEMPELLIADLGAKFKNLQVCLQPHVYIATNDEDTSSVHTESVYGEQRPPPMRQRPGKGNGKGRREDPFGHVDYDYSNNSFYMDGGMDTGNGPYLGQSQEAPYEPPSRFVRDSQFEGSQRSSGGVKDHALFDNFLSQTSRPPPSSPGASGYAASVTSSGSENLRYNPRTFMPTIGDNGIYAPEGNFSQSDTTSDIGRNVFTDGSLSEKSANYTSSKQSDVQSDQASLPSHGPAADSVPRIGTKFKNKMNKIQPTPKQVVASDSSMPTPFLDKLPPLRRAQFLQVVLRQVKACGGSEADKIKKAEEYMAMCDGDYDQAYNHVKSLG